MSPARPAVVRLRLSSSVPTSQVVEAAAAWSGAAGLDVAAPVRELTPWLLLGGPEPAAADDLSWLVVAARSSADPPTAFPGAGADATALDALADLVQTLLDRRPPGRDDSPFGPTAYAIALADGLARRYGGTVAVGSEGFSAPPPSEPTRNVRLASWPDPGAVGAALGAPLPGLVLTGPATPGEPWPTASCGPCGLWLEAVDAEDAEDAEDRADRTSSDWAAGNRPEYLPLLARPEDAWIVHVEGPDDTSTPAIDALLDGIAARVAAALAGVATDTEGFPVPVTTAV